MKPLSKTVIAGAILSGFTLTNGHSRSSGDWTQERCGGGALLINATLFNCIVAGNESFDDGAGIYCLSNSLVRNCLITENEADTSFISEGAGIYLQDTSTVRHPNDSFRLRAELGSVGWSKLQCRTVHQLGGRCVGSHPFGKPHVKCNILIRRW